MNRPLKVAVVGYGRMGHEVEQILLNRGHKVPVKIDPAPGLGTHTALSAEALAGCDAAIEFSLPEGVLANARIYAAAGVPAVVGTTGWEAQKPAVKALIEASSVALVHGTNFSIGAHMFFALVEQAAAQIRSLPEYDIFVTEYHHRLKKDSPSGTALTTANRILRALPRKTTLRDDKIDGEIAEHELHVASVRGGTIPGIHSVMLDSLADTLEIRHTARSRGGFALGSVLAAEWAVGRQGFIDVEEFARDLLKAVPKL